MKISFALLAAFVFCASAVFAQTQETRTTEKRTTIDEESGKSTKTTSIIEAKIEDITPLPQHVILVAPIKLFWMYNVSYFQTVSSQWVVGGGIQVPSVSSSSGVGFNFEARFFPSKKAMKGFYFAPNLAAGFYRRSSSDSYYGSFGDTETSNFTTLGFMAGWQWYPWNDCVIDFGFGVDMLLGSNKNSGIFGESSTPFYKSTAPGIRLNLGYAW